MEVETRVAPPVCGQHYSAGNHHHLQSAFKPSIAAKVV